MKKTLSLFLALLLCVSLATPVLAQEQISDGVIRITLTNVIEKRNMIVEGNEVPVCIISAEGAVATILSISDGYAYEIIPPEPEEPPAEEKKEEENTGKKRNSRKKKNTEEEKKAEEEKKEEEGEEREPEYEYKTITFQGGYYPTADGSYTKNPSMTLMNPEPLRKWQTFTVNITRLANVDPIFRNCIFSVGAENGLELFYMYDNSRSADFTAPINVTVNGAAVNWTDAIPFLDENDRVMIPLRIVAEQYMGLTVTWNHGTREAGFSDGRRGIRFPINSTTAYTSEGPLMMDTAAVSGGNRIYAPIRYLAEYFGYTVGWDANTRTVSITNW